MHFKIQIGDYCTFFRAIIKEMKITFVPFESFLYNYVNNEIISRNQKGFVKEGNI